MASSRIGAPAEANVIDAVAAGDLQQVTVTDDELRRIAELLHQHADLHGGQGLSLADASAVAVAEHRGVREIATLDVTDSASFAPATYLTSHCCPDRHRASIRRPHGEQIPDRLQAGEITIACPSGARNPSQASPTAARHRQREVPSRPQARAFRAQASAASASAAENAAGSKPSGTHARRSSCSGWVGSASAASRFW